MKTPIKKTLIAIFAALMMTGFAACGEDPAATTITPFPDRKTEAKEASAGEKADTVQKADSKAPAGTFKEAKLIKIGEHTYYPEDLFDHSDRDRDYKDHMIS